MRIFLAGATGVLGRGLVPLLVAAGHDVTALTRRAGTIPGATVAVADVCDADALAAAVLAAEPDVVVHQLTDLSGGDKDANAAIRVAGTRNLVDAARATGVRRMVAQSIAWAYVAGDVPAAEDVPLDLAAGPPRATTVGAVAVLEKAVAELPEWVVLRYGMFYGPATWYAPDGLMATAELAADHDVTSFVHVDDAAAAAVAALDWPNGAVNIVDDEPAPGVTWVPDFCRVTGRPAPAPVDRPRTGWARGASNQHARAELGWTPAHPTWRGWSAGP
jgi:nucleoside-diphosphate-sugar epimerase